MIKPKTVTTIHEKDVSKLRSCFHFEGNVEEILHATMTRDQLNKEIQSELGNPKRSKNDCIDHLRELTEGFKGYRITITKGG
jgi:hypothetical protein